MTACREASAGPISTIDRDMDITVVPFASDNEKAPTHRLAVLVVFLPDAAYLDVMAAR
ncbi:hypothetical protein [Sinorhizobium medicae]|uniref:hypothetical protein n=1 Tax=Sinorhizobium medicae TaxID=110321 RepID=UPI0012959540|nr:hypothetical protein [Sinorhizobium medicae]MQX79584.1 hypothetical protein [Sinorhizobium medicae]